MNAREFVKKLVADGISQTDIARKCKISNGTITKILYSDSTLQLDTIRKIANAYHVPLANFLEISSIAEPSESYFSRKIPVISQAQAGDNGYWEDCYPIGRALDWIPCLGSITDPHAFAVRVEGDSMTPRYRSGEDVIVDTTKPVVNNDDVVVKLHDESCLPDQKSKGYGNFPQPFFVIIPDYFRLYFLHFSNSFISSSLSWRI